MGRTSGTYTLTSNIEPKVGAPLDARTIVKLLADLTANNTFEYPYKGMKVFVEENNKSYTLVGSDPTISSNWTEDGSGGGHVIKNQTGTDMNQRSNLQFVDMTLSDDAINDITKVENIHVIQSESELTNLPDGLYILDDDEGTVIDGNEVGYDNTDSGLVSRNVQDAIDEVVETLDDKIDISAKGVANGVAELDATGKVPSSQLPSFVDDVIEVADYDHLPATGETGKIYVTLDTNKTYRWGGTEYVEISESLALGETSSTAYRGDRGKTAYDHSQLTSGNPHNVTKSDIGLDNVDNTSDSTKKTNFTGSIASGDTGFTTGGDVYTALGGKADKVSSATNGNLAGLNGTGNLTDSGWNGAKDTTSISGNPISISGLKSNQLAVNPIITLEPIQAGSGTPSPSNIRAISGYDKIEVLSCGKNLLYPTPYSGSYNMAVGSDLKFTNNIATYTQDTDGITIHVSTAWYCRTFATPILKAGTYRYAVNAGDANVRATLYVTDENLIVKQVVYNQQAGGVAIQTMTVTDRSRIAVTLTRNAAGDEKYKGIVVTEDDVTPPSPYEHCIKTTDLSESLGQTVYGLTHEVRTGKARVTWKKIVYDGSSDESWTKSTNSFYIAAHDLIKVLDYANSIKCDKLQLTSYFNIVDGSITNAIAGYRDSGNAYPGQNWIYIGISGISDVASLKTWLSNNPIEVCYAVTTPIEIQLTPHEISLLKDYAYVSTNGTSISLDYHNGEMASLSDVSQLGETVNELGDYVGRNEYSTTIALDERVGSSNKYEFPYDGYIYISSEAVTTGSIRVIITAYNSTQNIAYLYMNITSAYERQSLFVKKGMCLYLQAAIPSGTRVRYIPFM